MLGSWDTGSLPPHPPTPFPCNPIYQGLVPKRPLFRDFYTKQATKGINKRSQPPPSPGQNQNESLHCYYYYTTVVMCCQIVARKSVATSSGDFQQRSAPRQACGPDQEFGKKIFFQKINTPVPRPQLDLRKYVTSMIFEGLLVFFSWRAWQGSP